MCVCVCVCVCVREREREREREKEREKKTFFNLIYASYVGLIYVIANSKDADQLVYPHSLISAVVIRHMAIKIHKLFLFIDAITF